MYILQKFWILLLLLFITYECTTSAPVPGCKDKAGKPLRLKKGYSELESGRWILVERFKPGAIKFPTPPFLKRKKRSTAPSRPNDVPSTHCPWRWEYDFDENREPQYLLQAVCNNCNPLTCKRVNMPYKVIVKSCQKVNAKVPKRRINVQLWKKTIVTLPVAFYYKGQKSRT